MKRRRRGSNSTEVGRSVIKSLKEIRAWQRGKGTVRIVELPDPLPPRRIKAIRKKVAKSVRVFSQTFGLPAKTIQQWEQGARCPDAASSPLLEVIDYNPALVAEVAKRRESAA